jgi:hypothetical protein
MLRQGRASRTMLSVGVLLVAACSSSGGTTEGPAVSTIADAAPTVTGEGEPLDSSTTSASTSTSTTTTVPPTTTIALVVEGAVVLVANAADVPGAAALLSQQFAAVGFAVVDPTNAAGNERELDVSKVYYLPAGYDAALSIGAVMGGLEVAPMPTPAWITGATDALGDANVLVMLGKDLAGQEIPALVR